MESVYYRILGSIAVAAATLAIEELISAVISRTAKRAQVRPSVIRDVTTGLRIIAIVIIVSSIFGILGISSVFTSITISGIAALAASLALQSTLSNIIAGLLLVYDGVIHMDDVVEYSGVKGKVVRIALRNMWIKTESGAIATVSNSSLSNGPLINHTAAERLSKKYALH